MMTPHDVTIERSIARDEYGAPTFGPPATHAALVRTGARRTIDRTGAIVAAQGVAYVRGDVGTIDEGAVISVPDFFGLPARLPIVNAQRTADRDGVVRVTEVHF